MTRADHLSQARDRALGRVAAGELTAAVRGFVDDCHRHPEISIPEPRVQAGLILTAQGPDGVRGWLGGFA